MPREYVYVPLDELGERTLDDAASDGDLGFVHSVGPSNWTSDRTYHRNPFDSEDAEYLRIEKAWAEANLNPPGDGDE